MPPGRASSGAYPLPIDGVSAHDGVCPTVRVDQGRHVLQTLRQATRQWRRARDGEDGLSLAELMVAIFVLSVGVLALAGVAGQSLVSLRQSRDREQATDAASAAIEAVRALPYERINLLASDPDLPAGLGGCFEDEPLATTSLPGNAIDAFRHTAGNFDDIVVDTYITYLDVGDDDTCTDPDHDRTAKHVTVVATWETGGVGSSVRVDTVVADAGRGLPIPEFDLSPTAVPLNFSPAERDARTEKCIPHVLRNLGDDDTYDWVLTKALGESHSFVTPSEYVLPGATPPKYRVRALFEHPTQPTPPDPAGITDEATLAAMGLELMKDANANLRPEITPSSTVPAGDKARMWFCYKPGNVADGKSITFLETVHSVFDENQTVQVTHEVTVGLAGRNLHLFDPDDSAAHARDPGQPYLMGPLGPDQPAVLGTTLFDWDQPDGLPATRAGTRASGTDLRWHHQFTGATTLQPSVQLVFSTATRDALDNGVLDSPVPVVRLDIELERLRKNERSFPTPEVIWSSSALAAASSPTVEDGRFAYSHDTAGWKQHVLDIDLGGTATFEAEQYLRLRVSCRADSEAECHVAYDNDNHPSRLVVVVG